MAIYDQPTAGDPIAPPQNLDAEQSVLGAVLMFDGALDALQIDEGLKPEDFYREAHRVIYAGMLELKRRNQPIDALVLTEHLRTADMLEEAGGQAYVEALAGTVPAVGNHRTYGRIVREQALLRGLLAAAYDIQEKVSRREMEPKALVDFAESTMLQVAQEDRRKDFRHIDDILQQELSNLEELSRSGKTLTGTPSGYEDLDTLTGGLQPGALIILAARPSMGKSALSANMAEFAAINAGKPTAFFSLEMSESELAQRFIASQASVKGDDLRKGKIDGHRWPKILDACAKISNAPLFLDDSSDLSILDLRAKCRRLHQQQGGLGLVVVDYLQLMRGDARTDNRVEEVGTISRGLKALAKELEVPVVALSQLNRGVESRTDKKPMLSDLRESGQIEQDADLVMFLYREDYYDKESERVGEADLIIAKHRNGGLGEVPLVFQHEYPRFMQGVRDPDRYQ